MYLLKTQETTMFVLTPADSKKPLYFFPLSPLPFAVRVVPDSVPHRFTPMSPLPSSGASVFPVSRRDFGPQKDGGADQCPVCSETRVLGA